MATDRWVGMLDGAAYRIEVPKQWNGTLVMWARSYWTGAPLPIENPMIRRHLLEQGYAWAASSYTRNYYDVNIGIEDTNKLALQFQALAAQHGRTLTAPRRIYIAGLSMGGHIAAAAVEAEVVRDARSKVRYDGALSLCGSVAGVDWYDYIAAYQLAMQQLLGYPAEAYPSNIFVQNKAAMRALLPNADNEGEPSNPGVLKFYALMEQLSGGKRPFFREGWMDAYPHNILFQLANVAPTFEGILARNGMDTRQIQYRFNDTADADSQQFNALVRRITPDADANPLQSQGLRWIPLTNGQLTAPVMTMHTLGDLLVPLDGQIRYRERVASQGNTQRLTQRLVRDTGHCAFTTAEVATAFDDLVMWVEQGKKPGGDDMSDSRTWSREDAGCAFTNNLGGTEDRTTQFQRYRVQANYAACPPR